jgi:hypothetical protein
MAAGARTIDRGLRHELQSSLFPKLFGKKVETSIINWYLLLMSSVIMKVIEQ